jgi:hypothetical protein
VSHYKLLILLDQARLYEGWSRRAAAWPRAPYTQPLGVRLRAAGLATKFEHPALPALVADLIGRQVAVIVGNHNATLAAKAATRAVPIVFVTGAGPVRDGLVAGLNRPGGNVTGVSFLANEIGAKRLDLLRQLVPNAGTIAMLVSPGTPDTEAERRDVQAAGASSRAATHHPRRHE